MKKYLLIAMILLFWGSNVSADDCVLEGYLEYTTEVMLDSKPEAASALSAYVSIHKDNPFRHALGLYANIAFLDLVEDMNVGDIKSVEFFAVPLLCDPNGSATPRYFTGAAVAFMAEKCGARVFRIEHAKDSTYDGNNHSEDGGSVTLGFSQLIVYADGSIYVNMSGSLDAVIKGNFEEFFMLSGGEATATWNEFGEVTFMHFLEDDYVATITPLDIENNPQIDEILCSTYNELQSSGIDNILRVLGYRDLHDTGIGMGLIKVD